uniref:APC membrane recruitment protein 2 n=1 Tax=Neogobius melanostomus TaxID=47308 RepID=A0A8C6T6W1_9GOBI
MEVQADCVEPPKVPHTDPQPAGRINKAAFKLFGKRSTGSGMASFFSFRNKGATNVGNNGNSDNGMELIRSKTHDGLTDSNIDTDARPGEGHPNMEAVPVRSLSKSFSFFSFLRRGSFRASDNGGAGFVRRGRGLKGFFSSMRWRRKEKTTEVDVEEKDGAKEKGEEISECEKDITLTLEPPPPNHAQEVCGNTTEEPEHHASETLTTSVTMTPQHCPSVDRLCSLLFTDVTSLKSFDSLTGCGDIIADVEEEGPTGNGGSGTSSSSSGGGGGCSSHQNGSGIVAYMGGGEEMASPEGVDDADMQGLWHMLPSTADNSPALPRTGKSIERKAPQMKALGLSKIPVVGGAGGRAAKPPLPPSHNRNPTSPSEKELFSDEGYWDTPSATPMATPDESGVQPNQKIALSRDSCSGDHLYDLYNDPDEYDDPELNSTPSPSSEYKLSPTSQTTPPSSSSSSSFRSVKGSTSLPRESKIPKGTRPTSPPHSTSHSALSSVQEAELSPPKTQAAPPARTRIPVSKVPVRRSFGNKPGNIARGAANQK